ncbi:5-oxoprolinase subunit C family protein [Portibacter marinus]|uniref:5-oxoprolinase subunit C family protein n=1 Tax=Portibacter marinus TaxID=2898660 RepID=UPI001F253AAC|nr:biotin-dependent carboxyltransferase family protein [Portibacter marinus]
MNGEIEILKPGLMTSIQDLGRNGLAYFAIPRSGVMDQNAAKIALLLLDMPVDCPVIECTTIAPTIRFHSSAIISITGVDLNWKLNDRNVSINQTIKIKDGDVLTGGYSKDKMRAYIAIKGKLQIEKIFGSYSTLTRALIGGKEGRLLKKGDLIQWEACEFSENNFKIYKGPEFHLLDKQSQDLLVNEPFTIASDTDRMGMRLKGPKLFSTSALSSSVPVLPGFIQLPQNGSPIIILQDGQTTGGYPRIAYIRNIDLPRLNQLTLNSKIKFTLAH